jgi:hypothetical protein
MLILLASHSGGISTEDERVIDQGRLLRLSVGGLFLRHQFERKDVIVASINRLHVLEWALILV